MPIIALTLALSHREREPPLALWERVGVREYDKKAKE
jgi:hypothetical protein